MIFMSKRILAAACAAATALALSACTSTATSGDSSSKDGKLAVMGIPSFACTPDAFPEMIALAINKGDLVGWVSAEKAAKA